MTIHPIHWYVDDRPPAQAFRVRSDIDIAGFVASRLSRTPLVEDVGIRAD